MVCDLLAKENEVFLPTLRAVGAYPDGNLKIAQDNCSIHRARVVQEWFQEKRIQQLDWWSPYLRTSIQSKTFGDGLSAIGMGKMKGQNPNFTSMS